MPDQVLGDELVVDAALVLVVHDHVRGRRQLDDAALVVEPVDELVQPLVPLGVAEAVPVVLGLILAHLALPVLSSSLDAGQPPAGAHDPAMAARDHAPPRLTLVHHR
jgi:hypothetical protein